jgi:hypothetical protein
MKVIKKPLGWVLIAILVLSAFAVAAYAQEAPPTPEIPYLEDWQGSGHADSEAEAFRHWDEDDPAEVPADCAKCHSTTGYQDFLGADGSAAGTVDEAHPPANGIECVACHNLETIAKTSVVFPSGIEITGLGDESRCMECHQGRESKASVDQQIADFEVTDMDAVVPPMKDEDGNDVPFGFRNVHYFAAAATQYGTQAKGGYEYDGKVYDGKFEHPAPYNTCNGCHNQHTLELRIDECAACHTDVETVDDLADIRMNGSLMDYDGDGDATEGVSSEVNGLQEKLGAAITAYAAEVAEAPIAYNPAAYPYWFADANANGEADEGETAYANWTARLLQAAYNFQVASKDPGKFAHNAKYVAQLMYDSIADLNTKLAEPIDISKAQRNDAGHFDGTAMAFRDWDESGMVPANCAKCHSATGLPEFISNNGTVAIDSRGNVVTTGTTGAHPANGFACTTCHNDLTEFTLYPVTNVPFPSGKSVTFSTEEDADGNLVPVPANLCLECHQGRQSTASVNLKTQGMEDDVVPENGLTFSNVHYFAAGASLFGDDAQVAYQYADKEYAGRNMHAPGFQTCTECHSTHELELQFDKCVTCHAGAETPQDIRLSANDLDGDKDLKEGANAEIMALEEELYAAIQAYAEDVVEKPIAYTPDSNPYFFNDTNGNGEADEDEVNSDNRYSSFTPRLLRAAYNYQYVQKDPGAFAHNPKYIGQILYDSLEDLSAGGVEVDMTGMTRPEVPAQ